jgi:hypothetical protein
MFRTFLMTVLAVVAIGFGVGSTAEAGDFGRDYLSGPWIWEAPSKQPGQRISVTNQCVDNLPVYTMWFGNPLRVYPWNLDLAGLLALGARPVTPGPYGITIQNLVDRDGYLCVVDGNGGNMAFVPVTLERGPVWNRFRVTGLSTNPVVERY